MAFCRAIFLVQPARERARWTLDDDGDTLNSSHKKLPISSTYKPGISARWSQKTSSVTGVMLGGGPGVIVGELGLPNNLIFLRVLVIERSLHFARLAICDIVSLFLLIILCTIILYCQESWFRAILRRFRELSVSWVGGMLVLGRRDAQGYFWINNNT